MMIDRLVEDILERPDAAAIAAELERRLAEREAALVPLAARLAETEKDLVRVVRLLGQGERMYANDPHNERFHAMREEARAMLREVRAELKAGTA